VTHVSSREHAPILTILSAPIRYRPDFESVPEDESVTRDGLIDTITQIQKKVFDDSGQAHRGVHAKSHGVLVGRLVVEPDLAQPLAQGLFAEPRSFPVVMRFSTIPGDVLDDRISVPRGLSVKVIGVPGTRLPGTEGDVTQDFVMANGPVFAKSKPKDFLGTLKLLAKTTDKAPGLKRVLSVVMRGAEKLVESAGGSSSTLMTLGGYPPVHILGDEFYSQAPILYGDYMAKVRVVPSSPDLRALIRAPLNLHDNPDGIRDAVIAHFATHGGVWELQVQLCTDSDTMPLEDASMEWPQAQSPYLTVATIHADPQLTWSETRVRAVEEGMSFSPWHALAAHRPLGAIMRVRRAVYEAAALFRAKHLGRSVVEPKSLDELRL
jgi:hypothetical protein